MSRRFGWGKLVVSLLAMLFFRGAFDDNDKMSQMGSPPRHQVAGESKHYCQEELWRNRTNRSRAR